MERSAERLDEVAKEIEQRREERLEAEDAAREVAERRRELDEGERQAQTTRPDLDAGRVRAMRRELAKGGDQAVRRRFGEAAVGSPEAKQARTQQRAQQRRGREAMERGVAEAEAKRASRTPLRDAAIKQQRDREREPASRER
ncbi:hypothetical protein [Gordonia sp. 852002-51296_SCH5728562-b]|uniref:hypothetical protein n=1 Tax=Gordonia sp. 852002-51296_SCH5728562-b TaxID=1834101 RepID=UPI000A4D7398|nr:hypothetical protein [Gordonia sp. 852002-51296_SCH5728562-b]